jgi:hypothetical protein
MTRDALTQRVGELTEAVLADPRWHHDEVSVTVLCMILYGFALATGRIILFLDMDDIDAAVLSCLTERIGAAPKWSGGLVAEANASSMDQAHHAGHHELIGVGHAYFFGIKDRSAQVDNVFANIESVRRRAGT